VSERKYAANLDVPLEVTRDARNYNAWVYGRARPFLGRRVLDMGAGIGTFTELALADGRHVTALEPDTSFAAALQAEFGAHARAEIVCATGTTGALSPANVTALHRRGLSIEQLGYPTIASRPRARGRGSASVGVGGRGNVG
jgi:hypothetical protein